MTIFDFRKHKSCLYLLVRHSQHLLYSYLQAQTLQIRGGGWGLFDMADKCGDNL